MVKSLGVKYVLAGHSERRTLFKDNDAAINKKVLKIIEGGMIPVLCIGETKEEFDANLCEPVCAIRTGLVCPSETAQKVHKFLRAKLASMYDQATADAVRIQYGGSVTPDSVDELMSMPDIDGCLVGGASLDGEKFGRIL